MDVLRVVLKKNGGFGDLYKTTSEHLLKVRGNTYLQVEFFFKVIFKYCPAPTPGQRSINTFNEPILRAEGWQEAVVWLGHVIRLRGDTALSLCSLWAWGPMPRRVRGTDESGRQG